MTNKKTTPKSETKIKLARLKLNTGEHGLPKNPRFIRDDKFRSLCESIRDNPEYMPARPMIADQENNVVLGGNQRLRACRELGMTEVPASWIQFVSGWTLEKKRRFVLLDNRMWGEDDWDLLRDEWDVDEMLAAGFDQAILDEMMTGTNEEEKDEQDHDPQVDHKAEDLNKKWQVKPGDLWKIGDHRLICASCTEAENWDRLMQGQKAVMCHTDPPYGVTYTSGGRYEHIEGDDKRGDDLLANLLIPYLKLAMQNTEPDAPFYIWHADKTRRDFEQAIDAVGLQEKQYITWVKDAIVLGRADYHWQTEPAFYCQRYDFPCRWTGDRKQSTVWRVKPPSPAELAVSIANGIRVSDGQGSELYISAKAPKTKKTRLIRLKEGDGLTILPEHKTDAWEIGRTPQKERLHPTQKPTTLFIIPIENHTLPGELIVEPFAGGGGQFLAAEKTGRRCAGFELDPNYCAVVLERMEMIGITGTKEATDEKAKTNKAGRNRKRNPK